MAREKRKLEEFILLTAEAQSILSYADYFMGKALFSVLRVKNDGADSVDGLTLTVQGENGLTLPCVKELAEIPFESAVEIEIGNVLSPLYFLELTEIKRETVRVELKKDKKLIASQTLTVTAVPFDYWEGAQGNVELLAAYARPKLADCLRMRTEVSEQLKKWNVSYDFGGYQGYDKNAIRSVIAATFACVRKYSIEKQPCNFSEPSEVGGGVKILSERRASAPELALFVCACLENFGLHPILVFGEESLACGAWLYESCFLDTVSDDLQILSKYAGDGINNVSCLDVEDLFSDKNCAFSTSETHFKEKIGAGNYYEKYVDIRRCRIAGIMPLPLREKGVKGYEVLSETQASPDAAPQNLNLKKWKLEAKQTKNKQWERRLLDLSLKNALLNFTPERGAAHILSASPNQTYAAIEKHGEMQLIAASAQVTALTEKVPFGASRNASALNELTVLEHSSGILRSYLAETELNETTARLIRKNKEAHEESGTKILYLAFGFLKWRTKDDGKELYAPLVLQPVTLKKSRGGQGVSLALTDEEFSVNSTLLEFLKQEFNVDIRGLDGAAQGLKISEILAMVRAELVKMKGWEVFDDVYLAAFSFSRYQMWQDVRSNITEFSKNEIVGSLLNNRYGQKAAETEGKGEDKTPFDKTLTPLFADSSQWEAIALSQTGQSFVLHGPPGTGKSQTITNMIANALYDGKRVLFVAEKQAALSVVKKRLDQIGLGDFCLELHSNKTNKSDVLQKLTNTLALAGSAERVALSEKSRAIDKLKGELAEPLLALHKPRRLGVSVYEAFLICLRNKHAPDIMNIESTFYDSLTKEKIEAYEKMMVQAAAAAKECGGVCNSPFANVNLTEYSLGARDSVYCSSEVVIAEIKHLKSYLALFLELYRQRISTLTRTKLNGLYAIAKVLDSDALSKYFKEDEREFYAFFNANRRLDSCLDTYFKTFKKLVNISKEYKSLSAWLEKGGVEYEKEKLPAAIAKKLTKSALKPLKKEDMPTYLKLLAEIHEAMAQIVGNTQLSQYFTMAFGRVDYFGARRNFLSELYELHDNCAAVFMDYNADSFNSMCIRAANGYTSPVLKGLMRSVESFRAAEESFLFSVQADKTKIPEEDVLEYYTAKAGALIDNIDMLANWCMYKKTAKNLDEAGLTFMTDALENGAVTSENIVDGFEKNIYKNFLQTNIPLDPVLSRFSAAVLEEETEGLRLAMDEFAKLTQEGIRAKLISRLPTASTEGSLSLEYANFNRLAKSNLRGTGLRKLFEEIPELIKVLAPCMLMSPITVSQYLQAENGLFDLVIFDEASQMPTAEAIGSLARAKAAVIVGDPKQLPPTSFFASNYVDEENLENEDMESVLDDCLALGMPQRHLSWHYRSKHESLIAFSNLMYYGNRLCTFPSPDAPDSKVKFIYVEDGVYDRGFTKRNKAEADALIADVLERLSDSRRRKSSIGIVTFSNVQKEYIERKLTAAIAERKLEDAAFEREEPLFVKNLENVQGDERDVILFSVCYGPDKLGKISLNFGPLNQAGGWRRLNVAVSRAREEMVVYASMTGAMIDLSKTGSKGVAGLKAFLEFAQKGRTTLAIPSGNLVAKKAGIGKYIAEELSSYGYDCRYDVGVSDFKIDVAVIDPKNRHKFILAVMCDGENGFSVKDRNVLQIQTLKRNNWNVIRVFTVNYYNNPKREIKKIKDLLDKLTGADKKGGAGLNRGKKIYKSAALPIKQESANFVTSGENDGEIITRLKAIVAAEEPISYEFLIRRCLSGLGITKYGAKVENRMQALVALCGFKHEKLLGTAFYRRTDKNVGFDKYRVEQGEILRKEETDFTPYEIIAIARGALEDKVALYVDEILIIVASVLKIAKPSEQFAVYVNDCITLAEEKGLFVRSVSDRISLA